MGDTETYRAERSQGGWYLFEFAIVLFSTAVFIVGISDISRIFHARGAVRAGVTEGLRCLYPTDAGCNGQSMGNGWFPNDRFTARISSPEGNFYELPRESINLTSAWFNEPVSEASFATKQLTGVTLTQPRDAYRQYQVLFPGTAHAVYLLKTQELPMVAPGSKTTATESLLHPRFFEPGGRNVAREPDQTHTAPNFSVKTKGSQTITKEVKFTIPSSGVLSKDGASTISLDALKAYQAAYGFTPPCYQGAQQDLGGGSQGIQWPPSGSPATCSYHNQPDLFYNGKDLMVPIMIHVSGFAYIDGTSSSDWAKIGGDVVVELKQGATKRDLRGRSFQRSKDSRNSEQWGNFVVRGAGIVDGVVYDAGDKYEEFCKASRSVSCINNGTDCPECMNPRYVNLPLVKVDTEVTLTFTFSTYLIGGTAPSNDVEVSWGKSRDGPGAPATVRIFYPKFQATHEQRSCGYSASPNSCGTSVAPMQTSFRTTNLDQAFSYSNRTEDTCGRKNPDGYQPSIPSALEGFRSEIQAGARQLQPIAFWSNGTSSDTCSPNTSQAPCNETAREHMKGCEPEYTFPADAVGRCTLNDYQSGRDTISNPQFLRVDLQKKEARGGCTGEPFLECAKPYLAKKSPAFLGAVSNGCAVAQPVNTAPAFYGPMFLNTCQDLLPGLIEEYRKQHRVPGPITISPVRKAEEPIITDQEPNECWKHNKIPKDTRGTWVCAEASSYAVANNCCKKYGPERCSLEQITLGGGGGNGGGFDQLIEGARQRTFETVQAAYPPARMDLACGQPADGQPTEDDCIAIQAGPDANGTQAKVQASMRVPLALFDWFGLEKNTVVQYEESRTLESALVGEAG